MWHTVWQDFSQQKLLCSCSQKFLGQTTPRNMPSPPCMHYSAKFGYSKSNRRVYKQRSATKNGLLTLHLSSSLKVTGTDKDHLAICDSLLVIHSNHRAISYHFQDKQQFWSKVTNFSKPHVLNSLLIGFSLEFCNTLWLRKPEWCPYQKVYNAWWYVHSFRYNTTMWWTYIQTEIVNHTVHMLVHDKN